MPLTFEDFSRLSNKFANVAREMGIERGDRVMVLLGKVPEYQAIITGLLKLGAISIPAVAKPGEERGSIVKAYVVLAADYESNENLILELQEHCKKETAPYKYPREIEFIAELPKTASGKIRHVELRQRETAASTG